MPSFPVSATYQTITKTVSTSAISDALSFTSSLSLNNTSNIYKGTFNGNLSGANLDIRSRGNTFSVSAKNVNLSGTTRVVVSKTPLQLASFTTTERDALTPLNGDLILNTTTNKIQARVNGSWVDLH
jgi:hypothetical protein